MELFKIINEAMYNAALEINFPHSQENVDQLLTEIENNYGLKITKNTEVTSDLLILLGQAIENWKNQTELNN